MSCYVYQEALDPLCPRRQRRDAGLAREKHRWLVRTDASPRVPEAPFTYGHEPVRDVFLLETDGGGVPECTAPLADLALAGEVPLPPLHAAVLAGPPGEAAAAAAALAAGHPGPVWLAFPTGAFRRADGEAATSAALLREVLGAEPGPDEARSGWV
ncbi:MAG TPA: hypothetical protein VFQ45_22130, partial [Longimicrobium sp.]|nr:hypothetical protein [Longimicrobium sp.]